MLSSAFDTGADTMVVSTPYIEPTVLPYLKQDGLLREGHFAFKSGSHSGALIDRDRLLTDPIATSRVAYALSRIYFGVKVDTVACPSIWGAGLAQWVAYFLEPRAKVVYSTSLPDGSRVIAANVHDLIAGKRVLLVDNIIRSGTTMTWLKTEIERLKGEVIGVSALWDSIASSDKEFETLGLFNHLYPAWPADHCPLCAQGDTNPEPVPY
jgi:orotate phosphoribosyltransferase